MGRLEPPFCGDIPLTPSPGKLPPTSLLHHCDCHPTRPSEPCRRGPGGANRIPDESPELTSSHGQESSVCPWKEDTVGVGRRRAGREAAGAVCPQRVHAGRAGVCPRG